MRGENSKVIVQITAKLVIIVDKTRMAAKWTHMKSARAKRANHCFSLLSTQIFTVVVVVVVP